MKNLGPILRFSIDVDAGELVRDLESRLNPQAPDRSSNVGAVADPFLTRKEAASLMRITARQLDTLRATGRLGWIKRGNRVLLKRADILAWLNEGYVGVTR